LLTCHVYRLISHAIFPWPANFFSSAALKGLHEPCEFENERLLLFVDILYVDLQDGGHLASVLLEYEAELIKQPLLVTQLAERLGQQIPLFRGINVSVLSRRIDQRPLVYLIGVFALPPPAETAVDVIVYDSLEPGLGQGVAFERIEAAAIILEQLEDDLL